MRDRHRPKAFPYTVFLAPERSEVLFHVIARAKDSRRHPCKTGRVTKSSEQGARMDRAQPALMRFNASVPAEDLAGVPCALMMSTTRRKMRGGTSTFPFIIMRTVPTERSRRAASRFAPPSSSAAFSTERLYTSPMRRSFPGVGLELRRLVELFEQRLRLDRLHEVQLESQIARALLVVVASVGGHGDEPHARCRRIVAQSRGELVAVGIGQADVAENDVGRSLLCRLDAFPAAECD